MRELAVGGFIALVIVTMPRNKKGLWVPIALLVTI